MAQQIKNNTLGFLNKDDEERFVPKGDYVDALNVRRQLSSGGIPTPIKNIIGNELVTNSALASGDNVVIGETTLEENNSIYFFVWNSNQQHGIFQYNSITNVITKIVVDSFLNFQKTKYITGVNAFSNLNGDVLLYWTDNINPPRKINASRAILHNKGDFANGYAANFSSGSNAVKSAYYDAVKHPPLTPITFSFSTDPSRLTNNIEGKTFQFRYRYIYDDGERSAYAPWSKLAISDKARLNNSIDANSYDSVFNNIRVDFTPSDKNNVERVELTYREGNTGDERVWFDLENNVATSTEFFYNDSVSPLVGNADSLKLYDAVPLLAKSQEIKDNVLFYGNTVDGFDLPKITSGTKVVPYYNDEINPEDAITIPASIVVAAGRIPTGGTIIQNNVVLDFSSVASPLDVGWYFNLSFNVNFNGDVLNFSYNYSVQQGDDIDSVGLFFANEIGSRFDTSYDNSTKELTIFAIRYNNTNLNTATLSDEANFYIESLLTGVLTHKSGAYHPYGIVYYDRANRSSSVLKIGNPYVDFITERSGDSTPRGSVGMSMFLDFQPPVWATHWQPVYAGNSTVDEYLQYTCSGVYKGKDVTTSNNFDRIYLSLRNLKGTDESWKDSTGAIPDYNYVEGDRIRVISYLDPTTTNRVQPTAYLDFKVVGFEVLPNTEADNPLITSADNTTVKQQKAGYFLILEDPKVEKWDVGTGSSQSTGYWFNDNAQQGAYFEIYRPKTRTEDFPYYEIGEKFSILNAGTSTRIHDGGVRQQNAALSYGISSATRTTITTTDSAIDLVVGDTIEVNDSADNLLLSTTITKINQGQTNVTFDIEDDLLLPDSATEINLTSTAAVTNIVGGDSWYKPRALFRGNGLSFESISFSVEDYYANDFMRTSASWDRGRPHIYSPEARRVRRRATVWFSEPFYPQDDIYNGFSAFNLSNTPYRDYDQSYGGIQVMKQNNDGIILWQEDKTSKILVDRNVIESAEGQATLTTNQDKLGIQVFYKGDYGIAQQPESLNGSDGIWYFLDLKRGKYLRLSNDGITPVSDYKMRNYFYDTSKLYLETYAQTRIKGGYDARNEESIITFPSITTTVVTTSSGDLTGDLGNAIINDGTESLDVEVEVEVGSPNKLTFGNEKRLWSEITEPFGQWGGNLYSTNDLSENATVQITSDQNAEIEQTGTTVLSAYVNLNTNQGDFVSLSSLDVSNGILSIPTNDANYPIISAETTTVQEAFTLAFYEPANRWSTFYSYIPDFYSTLNSLFVSWQNGILYKHGESSLKNNFYGTTYPTTFSPIINDAPFEVKAYNALMIEGTTPLDIVATTNLNGTSMSGDDFVLKEGRYYGYLPFATTSSGDSAIIGLGEIQVRAAGKLTVIGDISHSGIFVGDSIHDNDGNKTTITAINGNVITVASSAGFTDDDYVYVLRPNIIDGDRIRGAYLKLDCTITTNDQDASQEIYSVDVEASKSYY